MAARDFRTVESFTARAHWRKSTRKHLPDNPLVVAAPLFLGGNRSRF
ncbi:hypothetical protein [Tepidimonas taiwanensis]|nr:hypothetical protein [Tepidimonas taiwanensis]